MCCSPWGCRVGHNLVPEQRVLSFFHVLGPVLNILRGFKHLILKTALRIGTAVGFILEKTEAQR